MKSLRDHIETHTKTQLNTQVYYTLRLNLHQEDRIDELRILDGPFYYLRHMVEVKLKRMLYEEFYKRYAPTD